MRNRRIQSSMQEKEIKNLETYHNKTQAGTFRRNIVLLAAAAAIGLDSIQSEDVLSFSLPFGDD